MYVLYIAGGREQTSCHCTWRVEEEEEEEDPPCVSGVYQCAGKCFIVRALWPVYDGILLV